MSIDPTWTPRQILLDLDGTLYPSTLGMERQIVPALQRTIAAALGLDLEAAVPIIADLNRRYGYCVRGVASEYGVDPAAVIAQTYAQLDRSGILPNEDLAVALKGLRELAPILILTNSSQGHAHDVLTRLGLSGVDLEVAAIEDVGFFLKPDEEVYLSVRDRLGVPFGEMLYIDDSVRNLHVGWRSGMKCVLVNNGIANPPMFWENHLQIEHTAPAHIDATHDLVQYLTTFCAQRSPERSNPNRPGPDGLTR